MAPTGPPSLPQAAPAEVRAFLQGDRDVLELTDGQASWVPVPAVVRRVAGDHAAPRVRVRPAPDGAGDLAVGWGPLGLTLRVGVADGRLTIAFPGRANPLLRVLRGDIRIWVDRANSHLHDQGRRLDPLELRPGRAVLRSRTT